MERQRRSEEWWSGAFAKRTVVGRRVSEEGRCVRGDEGEVTGHQRDRHLDGRVVEPAPHLGGEETCDEPDCDAADGGSLDGRFEDMFRSMAVAFYGSLIMFAIVAQGGAALFYFTREKYLREYRRRTPAWILQMQKTGVSV